MLLDSIQFLKKDVYKLWNIGFAYIISKNAAKKIIDFINNCSIKCAIDNPQAYGEVIKYHYPSQFIIKHKNMDVFGSDINNNLNCLQFTNNINNVKHGVFINSTSNFFKRMFGAV